MPSNPYPYKSPKVVATRNIILKGVKIRVNLVEVTDMAKNKLKKHYSSYAKVIGGNIHAKK